MDAKTKAAIAALSEGSASEKAAEKLLAKRRELGEAARSRVLTRLGIALAVLAAWLFGIDRIFDRIFGDPVPPEAAATAKTSGAVKGKSSGLDGFVIGGYVPEYRLDVLQRASVTEKLSDIVLFSIEVGPDGLLQETGRVLPYDRKLRERFGGRISVCVGGAGRSAHFDSATTSERSRSRLAEELLELAAQNDLDGVDLDWEAPSSEREVNNYDTHKNPSR